MFKSRKSNNQLIKRTDQKLKDLPQMAGHPVRHQAQRPLTGKNPQKQQRTPMGQRTPPAEEEESRVVCERSQVSVIAVDSLPSVLLHLQVKCKNYGAFGHSARSETCPMKRWSGALPLQPRGSHKGKENLQPAKPQLPQAPGPFMRIDRGKEQGRR
ncbi:hypothetical protein H8958_012175 [Nasalis larvatus]